MGHQFEIMNDQKQGTTTIPKISIIVIFGWPDTLQHVLRSRQLVALTIVREAINGWKQLKYGPCLSWLNFLLNFGQLRSTFVLKLQHFAICNNTVIFLTSQNYVCPCTVLTFKHFQLGKSSRKKSCFLLDIVQRGGGGVQPISVYF